MRKKKNSNPKSKIPKIKQHKISTQKSESPKNRKLRQKYQTHNTENI